MIVAIDGPSGSGKSSVARAIAKRCSLTFLDTGAMYRSVAAECLRAGVDPEDAGVGERVAGDALHHRAGQAERGAFIVDPDDKIQVYQVNAGGIGRNAVELLRLLQAAKFVAAHGDQVCPAKWHPGSATLTPGLDLVGRL